MGTVSSQRAGCATGQVTPARSPARLRTANFTRPDTSYVFNARLAGGLKRIFYMSGSYTVQVPPGRMAGGGTKGFEYWPASKEITVRAGETADIEIPLKRRIDMPAKGWFNGSTHVHMNYGGNLRNTPENLLLTARCEGMHIVSSLVANKDNRIFDWQYFHKGGEVHPASDLAANRCCFSVRRIVRRFGAHFRTEVSTII